MDEYKLFLEHVNKLVDRRQTTTTIYLTVNTAIVGAIGLVFVDASDLGWRWQIAVLLLLVAGMVACDLWRRLITQYSTLLAWWFGQLRGLENELTPSSKLLSKEYGDLYLEHKGRVRIGLTRYEIRLAWLFTAVYVTFGLLMIALLLSA